MTTVELLAYCNAQKPQPCIPDLLWQREMHRDENLGELCYADNSILPNGFNDMSNTILEGRSWLVAAERAYASVLFTEDTTCSKPQK